jgi:KaiC/GvpD/RAD55 family RecA-like ATPase
VSVEKAEVTPSLQTWAGSYEISQEEADMISDPQWIIKNMIIRGHVVAFCAEPNGGKTTILFHLAKEMTDMSYEVFYVNADISGGDAKVLYAKAKKGGFNLLLPDMKVGKSMMSIVDDLTEMNESDQDMTEVVFIFDTLKKMTDVIQKGKAKELYKLFRSMSAKGATVICLCHTNKYNDSEGNPVYEGTSDLRSDLDELIFLIPEKHQDGSITVSTKPDKVRGDFKPISYNISPDREVSLLPEYVDTGLAIQIKRDKEKDKSVIELVTQAIKLDHYTQSSIVDYCIEHHVGRRPVEKVLNRYRDGEHDSPLWIREKRFESNAWNYKLTTPLSNVQSANRTNRTNRTSRSSHP